MKRPMVWVATAFVAGLGAASAGAVPGWFIPFILLAGGLLIARVFATRFASRHVSVSMAAFAAGALLWNAQHAAGIGDPLSRYAAQNPQQDEWSVEGTVRLADIEDSQPGWRQFILDVDTVHLNHQTLALQGATMVGQFRPEGEILATQRLRVKGRLTTTLGRVNPGVSGYEGYLRSKGVHTAIVAESPDAITIVSPGRRWAVAYGASVLRHVQAERIRRSLRANLAARSVEESPLGFVNAIWLGYRSQMPPAEYQTYVESGTVHILSVSGIHMAMVFYTGLMLARTITQSRRKQAIFILAALGLFTLMSGLRPSALRSAAMLTVYLMADILGRERDAPTALAVSAVGLLGWNTNWLFDTGFQLSFLSVASLILFTKPLDALISRLISRMRSPRMPAGITRYRMSAIRMWLENLRTYPWFTAWRWDLTRISRWPQGLLAASLAVQILPFPLAIGAFHVVPLGSSLANLFVIPLSTFALWLCLLTQITGLISDGLAQICGHALVPVVWCIRSVSATVAKPAWSHCILTTPTMVAMACYWGAALLCAAHLNSPSRWKHLIPAAVLLVVCIVSWYPWRLEPVVTFLDVGHGDAMFLRSDEGRTMLVDGADRTRQRDMGQNTVAPFLWCNHVRHLDCVALSHPDRDHIGGLRYILERFDTGLVVLGAHPTDRPMEDELISTCARMGVPVRRVHAGETLVLGSMAAEVLSPPDNDAYTDVNDQSLVLRVRWNGTRILLPGDIESSAEARLARNDCAADVLKVPHHGSRTSSSGALLQAVHPSHCVISTGGERGREPVDDTVLERYRSHGIPTWRTDWYGAITLHVRDGQIRVSAERIERRYPCPAPPVDNPTIRAAR